MNSSSTQIESKNITGGIPDANVRLMLWPVFTVDGKLTFVVFPVFDEDSVNNTRFEYDKLNRLTATQNADNSNALNEAYSYDHWNNRRSVTASDNSVKAYIYDTTDAKKLKEIRQTDANGALLASFSYDDNGNLLNKTEGATTLTLSYDALDRLSSASKTGSPTESYRYDPSGNRIEKTVGGNTTYYRYQGPDIAAQYENGWTEADYTYTHGPQWDDPLIRTDATDMSQYYHQDALGSVVSTTNMAGTIEATARYDAWGITKESSGNIPQYGYTGREPDATGLMYYRARYYDPAIGRFTQRDPKGYIDGVNRYAYAINNPVNYTDPRGTDVLNVSGINWNTQSTSYCSTCGPMTIDLGFGSGSEVMSSGSQSLNVSDQSNQRIDVWNGKALKDTHTENVPVSDVFRGEYESTDWVSVLKGFEINPKVTDLAGKGWLVLGGEILAKSNIQQARLVTTGDYQYVHQYSYDTVYDMVNGKEVNESIYFNSINDEGIILQELNTRVRTHVEKRTCYLFGYLGC